VTEVAGLGGVRDSQSSMSDWEGKEVSDGADFICCSIEEGGEEVGDDCLLDGGEDVVGFWGYSL
jgi:hypothetical protein